MLVMPIAARAAAGARPFDIAIKALRFMFAFQPPFQLPKRGS